MDRRQKKTRFAIFSAFTALLAKKSYSQISVQEIIDTANVGRTTFYSHFETKDYLLKELCRELFDHIIDSTGPEHPEAHGHYFDCAATDSVFLHLILHLQKNDNHILDLLSSENNNIFKHYFKENLKKLVLSLVNEGKDLQKSNLPQDYLVNHIAATFVETVDWWLVGGMRESPKEITEYFLAATEPIFSLKY